MRPEAIGRFLVPEPLPERLLYAEPLRRRMRVKFGGAWIADSEDAVLLHEPGQYAVAYFPLSDINPALTFGLWLQRTVSSADLVGYCAAQLAGALLGVTVARLWGPTVSRAPVDWAIVKPAPSIPQPAAAGLECAATLVQLSVLFILLSSRRHHQWTPVVGGAILTVAIVVLAPVSGGGINPVRRLAPDNLAGAYPGVWIYVAAPLLGAALASAALTASRRRPITGKLRHDSSIECHMRCTLPGPPGHGPDQGFDDPDRR